MKRIAVIGGGAAGFFAAISAAECDPNAEVTLFERSKRALAKVAISGGGRCNVTHACFEPRDLARNYPRGSKELRGAFHSWQPLDTVEWYKARGVELKTEADGRMFPTTDSSGTIVTCLEQAVRNAGVTTRLQTGVTGIQRRDNDDFELSLSDGSFHEATSVILTTGGGQSASGHRIAESLGHTITELAPSLFTFHIDDPLIDGLAGLSIHPAEVSYPPAKRSQTGPVLFTHWGLSGPAILKLSAWGARVFKSTGYQFDIRISWLGKARAETARAQLDQARRDHAKRQLGSINPFDFPKRFWVRMLALANVSPELQWAQLSKPAVNALVERITNTRLHVTGKSANKEEFVTCGGVALNEVDFKTMQSKRCHGLYFAGEVLDIDGVTGGFNFQAAWTTARLAGLAAAKRPVR